MTYVRDPADIERKSMELIEQAMDAHALTPPELGVVTRVIHATGDLEYQRLIAIAPGAIDAGIAAIRRGCRIVTDTRMAHAGINKRALDKAGCRIDCYVADEQVFALAREQQMTRAMAAIDLAVRERIDLFVIGNAPTALYRLGEYIEQTRVAPELIIGTPVGFVGAAESKAYLRSLNATSITTIGTKGGSNVAAAMMNAIIYMAVGRA